MVGPKFLLFQKVNVQNLIIEVVEFEGEELAIEERNAAVAIITGEELELVGGVATAEGRVVVIAGEWWTAF